MTAARVDRVSRLVPAPPERIYDALVDPEALVRWLPPEGMTGRIDAFEPRAGGRFEMTLAYSREEDAGAGKSSADEDRVRGRFAELVPGRRVVQLVRFESDDPAFAGPMRMTWQLDPERGGTRVTVSAEDVPAGIRPEDHERGMRSTLAKLAAFLAEEE